jgi:deoxycytidylate deaminase
MIINSGVTHIIFQDGYPDALAAEMLKESGLKITQYRKSEGRETRDEGRGKG